MKKNKKNIYIYFIKMLLIFISLDIVMMLTSNILASTSLFAKYGTDLITEIFYAFAVLIVMLLFHNSYVFTEKKNKLVNGILLGLPILVISAINLTMNIATIKSFSIVNFINVLILCIFIGISEEFLCRGWLQNEFIERYSHDKKTVLKSILLSSLVFGFMHIINLGSQTVFETILQIINATSLGMLLGSIYYKTKNIWSVIFLHAFYDFAFFIGEMNLIKDCTYNIPTISIALASFLSVLFISSLWVFAALKIINSITLKKEKEDKKKKKYYTLMGIIAFVLVILPFENLIPDYDKYKVCYNYVEIDMPQSYVEHFPHLKNHYIDSTVEYTKFDDELYYELKELTIDEEVIISFRIEDDYVIIQNDVTNYLEKIKVKDANRLLLIENEDNYLIVIESLENEATIYLGMVNKSDLRNSRDLIEYIAKSFKNYSLPRLNKIGYITFENSEVKYPYFISENNDRFIIKNESLYLIK